MLLLNVIFIFCFPVYGFSSSIPAYSIKRGDQLDHSSLETPNTQETEIPEELQNTADTPSRPNISVLKKNEIGKCIEDFQEINAGIADDDLEVLHIEPVDLRDLESKTETINILFKQLRIVVTKLENLIVQRILAKTFSSSSFLTSYDTFHSASLLEHYRHEYKLIPKLNRDDSAFIAHREKLNVILKLLDSNDCHVSHKYSKKLLEMLPKKISFSPSFFKRYSNLFAEIYKSLVKAPQFYIYQKAVRDACEKPETLKNWNFHIQKEGLELQKFYLLATEPLRKINEKNYTDFENSLLLSFFISSVVQDVKEAYKEYLYGNPDTDNGLTFLSWICKSPFGYRYIWASLMYVACLNLAFVSNVALNALWDFTFTLSIMFSLIYATFSSCFLGALINSIFAKS